MPQFEFSKWDGSQQFRPLSADAVFDKLAEHLLEYGDYVLRQLEHLDDDNADLVKLLVKEGYLEKDDDGKYAVAPHGVRRIENKAIEELFTIRKKDALENQAKDQMVEQFIQRFQFPVPETFVQQQIDARLERGLRALANQGMTPEDIKGYIRFIADWRLRQLNLPAVYGVTENPLPWLQSLLSGVEHANFFEARSTEYSKAATRGAWHGDAGVWGQFDKMLAKRGERDLQPH